MKKMNAKEAVKRYLEEAECFGSRLGTVAPLATVNYFY